MKRNVIDTKFGGPKDQEVLCSSDYKTPKNFQQYYRSTNQEDPWLSYLDHGTSAMMYGEAGKCAYMRAVLCTISADRSILQVMMVTPRTSRKAV